MAKSSRYANCAGVVRSSAAACNPFFPENPKFSCAPQIQEFAQRLQRIQFERRHLHFEVVDDTALIDTSLLSKGKIGKNRLPKIKNEKKNEKKKVPRRQARKDWKIKKTAGGDREKAAAAAAGEKKYSRAEMVALSHEDLEGQMKKWSEVYATLAASVAAEYDGLVAAAGAPARRGGLFPSFASHRRPSFMENKPDNIDVAAAATAMGKGSPMRISVH